MFNFNFGSYNFTLVTTTMESLYKSSYDLGLYTKNDIANFVKNGSIDSGGYERITGDKYEKGAKKSKA